MPAILWLTCTQRLLLCLCRADQKRYWKGDRAAYTFVSPQEIADTFYSTTEPGKDIMRTLEQPFNPEGVDMSAIITTK